MELLSIDKYEIFIKKFEHFLAMLFQNCARLLNIKIVISPFYKILLCSRKRRKTPFHLFKCLIHPSNYVKVFRKRVSVQIAGHFVDSFLSQP